MTGAVDGTKEDTTSSLAMVILNTSHGKVGRVREALDEPERSNVQQQETAAAAAAATDGGVNGNDASEDPENKPTNEEKRRTIQDSKFGDLLEEEIHLRSKVKRSWGASETGSCFHVFGTAFINLFSAIMIFALYLVSLESLLSIALSAGLTIYSYEANKDNPDFNGGTMNWVLLSFAVVTPISASIGMAFTRRERSLTEIANFKATMMNLYMAHACWDWVKAGSTKPTGRAACSDVNWLEHNDEVLQIIFRVCSVLTRLLTLPTSNRGRSRVLSFHQKRRTEIERLARKLQRNIKSDMCLLTSKCEVLKREGLPPNEATRVRQWERFIAEQFERLLNIKRYRTPQALRSFARCFTVFLPPFYAPFYGTMATDLNSLGMAIAFSVITSLALTSLFEAVAQLEDPFVGRKLDGVNVERDLRDEFLVELLDSREYFFPDAPAFVIDIKIPNVDYGPTIRLFQAS